MVPQYYEKEPQLGTWGQHSTRYLQGNQDDGGTRTSLELDRLCVGSEGAILI